MPTDLHTLFHWNLTINLGCKAISSLW